jgi:hypothetical protein
MAKTLSNSGIVTGQPVEAQHVSQSVNALTGAEAYDITISGSLSVTGPVTIDGLTDDAQINVITYDPVTKQLHYTGSANLNIPTTQTFPYTGSAVISGSLTLTGSFNAAGGLTGSLLGTASNAVSASFATTASYSLNSNSSSYAATASYVLNAVSTSYALNVDPAGNLYEVQYNNNTILGATSSFKFIFTSQSLQQGDGVSATGQYSHAEGQNTTAYNDYSHAEGSNTIASGLYSHAEGDFSAATSFASHAEGALTQATNNYAHSEGAQTRATGNSSHAEGGYTRASGLYAHTEGYKTTASGDISHAEGYETKATNFFAHSEGFYTIASGTSSHAEGSGSLASGQYSHAEGAQTTSSGNYSHTEGKHTITVSDFQHAQGIFNLPISGTGAFIVGNGSSNTSRSNLIFASGTEVQITGSLNAPNITGSLQGTSSWATTAVNSITASYAATASYVQNAQTASYILNAVSASYAATASYVLNAVSASRATTASYALTAQTASYALTASYVKNAQTASYLAGAILQNGNQFGTAVSIGAQDNQNITFLTNNTTKVTITSSGEMGIGTTTPDATLEVVTQAKTGQETLFKATVNDDTATSLQIINGTATDGLFLPVIRGSKTSGTGSALLLQSRAYDDSGTTAFMTFNARYGEAVIPSTSSRPAFTFVNYTTELMRVMPSGDIGINTIANTSDIPSAKLHIVQNVASSSFRIDDVANDTTPFIVDASGNVGVGKSTPTSSLDVNGNVTATTYTASIAVGSVGFLGTASWAVSSSRAITASYTISSLTASYSLNTDPAGATYDIQYNNGTVLGAESAFNYSPSTHGLQQGLSAIAQGSYSHAQGWNTLAKGDYSHAEGVNTLADGNYSHAEGSNATSSGQLSHAEGLQSQAIGVGSHAEGAYTIAYGNYSHAEGASTTSYGPNSHAEGLGTIASGSYQHAQGQYNKQGDSTSLMIVGNGTGDGSRSDAFKVRMSGSIVLPTTRSAAPTWTGTDGEMIFATVSGNHRFYVWMAGAWRSGSLS